MERSKKNFLVIVFLLLYICFAVAKEMEWFENAVIYQVFIKSFQDSDGDGIGDFQGLTSRLDYIKSLGVNVLYLNPVFKAQFHSHFSREDLGYAALDLKQVEPSYGTIEDFRHLVSQAHKRGLKVMMDFINLGFSSQNEWFVNAAKDPHSPWADFFLIRSPKPEGQWLAYGEGAKGWYSLGDGRYYYSLFGSAESGGLPMINYQNPQVVEYMLSVADFWQEMGVDGFRLDAAKFLFIHGPGTQGQEHQPETFSYWKKFKARMNSKFGKNQILAGEILPVPVEQDYIGKNREMLDFLMDGTLSEAVFSFDTIELDQLPPRYINSYLSEGLLKTQHKIIYLSNHDRGRIAAKIVQNDPKVSRLLACILLLANGTPSIYFGDEIGITGDKASNRYESINYLSSMAWNAQKNGGFSINLKPRPPISEDFLIHNVQSQEDNPDSLLNFYRQTISFRRSHLAFSQGSYKSLRQPHPKIFWYLLHCPKETLVVVHNLSRQAQKGSFPLSEVVSSAKASLLFSNGVGKYSVNKGDLEIQEISPFASLVFQIYKEVEKIEIKEHQPDLSNAIAPGINSRNLAVSGKTYSLPDSSKNLAIELLSPSQPNMLYYYNSEGKERNAVPIKPGRSRIIPLADDTAYFQFNAGIEFMIIPFSWENFFSQQTKLVMEERKNQTLQAFHVGEDEQFWMFYLEREKMVLPLNGGYDFALLIDDPKSDSGAKEMEFWLLPKIVLSNSVENMIGLQYGMREKKPLFYADFSKMIQPGIRTFTNIIFHESTKGFMMLLNRDELPQNTYNISLISWSAGGRWGDKPPAKWPIAEMLPANPGEMQRDYPNHIESFVPIGRASVQKSIETYRFR